MPVIHKQSEQENIIAFYIRNGFVHDKAKSLATCGIVLKRGEIYHVFGLDGTISLDHDFSKDLTIKVN